MTSAGTAAEAPEAEADGAATLFARFGAGPLEAADADAADTCAPAAVDRDMPEEPPPLEYFSIQTLSTPSVISSGGCRASSFLRKRHAVGAP